MWTNFIKTEKQEGILGLDCRSSNLVCYRGVYYFMEYRAATLFNTCACSIVLKPRNCQNPTAQFRPGPCLQLNELVTFCIKRNQFTSSRQPSCFASIRHQTQGTCHSQSPHEDKNITHRHESSNALNAVCAASHLRPAFLSML